MLPLNSSQSAAVWSCRSFSHGLVEVTRALCMDCFVSLCLFLHLLCFTCSCGLRLSPGLNSVCLIWLLISHVTWNMFVFIHSFIHLFITLKTQHVWVWPPSYTAEMLTAWELVCFLITSGAALKSRLQSKGDPAFTIWAPQLRRDLPEEILPPNSVASFKSLVKAHFSEPAFM